MKKIITLGLLVTCVLTFSSLAYAGSHSGTYDMTGGIFYKKAFSKDTELTITVNPTQGSPSCEMGIFTAKKHFMDGMEQILLQMFLLLVEVRQNIQRKVM